MWGLGSVSSAPQLPGRTARFLCQRCSLMNSTPGCREVEGPERWRLQPALLTADGSSEPELGTRVQTAPYLFFVVSLSLHQL